MAQTPLVQQRRLRQELRRAREQAGLIQKDVAEALDWSTSKLIRIETGAVNITVTDLRALLHHYGVTDRDRVQDLEDLARGSRKQAWWDKYRGTFSQPFLDFLGYEASASLIRQYHSLLIPGLLQTRDYAREVITVITANPDMVDVGTRARMERQAVLDQPDGPRMYFVLDEAAMHRMVGGPDVMRAQLLRLEKLSHRPNIRIQALPFGAGAHPGMRNSFEIFEFASEDEENDYAVALDNAPRPALIRNDPEQASSYVEIFFELESRALSPGDTRTMIRSLIERLPGDNKGGSNGSAE